MTHPTAEQVAAHVEHRLTGAEREAMLQHLEACADCRIDVVETSRFVVAVPARRRRGIVPTIATLAAAVALVVIARLPRQTADSAPPPTDGHRERVAQPDVTSPIRIISPGDDELVSDGHLVWNAESGDAIYHVTLQDEAGRVIRTWDTAESTLVLPDTTILPRGHAYYWSVDALGQDGRSTTSKAHRFRR